RQQQQALAVVVEATNMEQPAVLRRQQFVDGGTTLRIAACGYIPAWLVQRDPDRRRRTHAPAIHLHHIARRVDLDAGLGRWLPVHAHATGLHQLLGCASRRDARLRQELLQANARIATHGSRSGPVRDSPSFASSSGTGTSTDTANTS